MKIFKIAIPFWQHWLQLQSENPQISDLPWAEQQKLINRNWCGFPPAWKDALEPHGYEVLEVLANVELVQKTWATERGFAYGEDSWKFDILKAQILDFKPEVLFVADMFQFSKKWIEEVRRSCPSIRLVMGWCGGPWPDETLFRAYDLTLSCVPEIVDILSAKGHRTLHFDHSFDAKILPQLDTSCPPSIDFSFIGNINRNSQFHLTRDYVLERLVDKVSVEIFSLAVFNNDSWRRNGRIAAKAGVFRLANALKSMGLPPQMLDQAPLFSSVASLDAPPRRAINPKLKPFMQPPRFGLSMFQTLRDSKATFNSHIDLSANSASNMRLFEATGVGTCLVTDHKANLHTLFEPDREVVTYRCAEECIEKVKWLMEHPQERQAIAEAGQMRTLQAHTLAQRAVLLDEILQQELCKAC